jgi:class 3 adenylate cyclase
MVGSTELTGRFDPEDLRAATRSYLEICHAAVEALGGHVASYHGDGALACFGWPKAHEDDPERAVHAALKIIRDLKTSLVESAVSSARHPTLPRGFKGWPNRTRWS